MAVMNADVVLAGYALTTAGVIQYVTEKLAGYVFSQVSTTVATGLSVIFSGPVPGRFH